MNPDANLGEIWGRYGRRHELARQTLPAVFRERERGHRWYTYTDTWLGEIEAYDSDELKEVAFQGTAWPFSPGMVR